MTVDQAIVFAILAGALVLFVWNRLRYDVVALLALLAGVVAGVVPAEQAFTGFSDPVVITVAAVLVISSAIRESGLIEMMIRPLLPHMKRTDVQVFALSGMVAVLSAFMNNVGALAIFLPVALQIAHRTGQSPAVLLMPLSFGSLLGGLATLIGTPPNILISGIRRDMTGQGFAMFDFAPVGVGIAAAGVLVLVFGWRLLPRDRRGQTSAENLFRIEDYTTEVRIPPKSPLVGRSVADLEAMGEGELTVTAIIREKYRRYTPSGRWALQADDIVVIEADPHALKTIADSAGLEVVGSDDAVTQVINPEDTATVEAVVTSGSQLVACSLAELRLRDRFAVNVLAVAQRGTRTTVRLRRIKFKVGDLIVLQGNRDTMPETLRTLGCLPLAERNLRIGRPRKAVIPVAILGGAVGLTVLGIVPVAIAFLGAVILIILAKVLTLREVYDSVAWPVLILLGALLPVSNALQTTGGTELIAGWLSMAVTGLPAVASLTLVMVVTMLITLVLNNAATVLVMAPIAASFANQLGMSIDPFLMAVAVGASCAFMTPIGHQSNTLVMEPGGYRFTDYWRLGLPVSIVVVAVGVPLILWVWPLQ